MLHAAELLDSIVATVVVGQDKSLRGDDLSRTAPIEAHNGILERGAVGVVEVILLELNPPRDEGGILLSELLHEPHPLISLSTEGKATSSE